MKRYLLLLTGLLLVASLNAAIKIDFNRHGTNESQCNEVNYMPWNIGSVPSDTKTIDGVTITVRTGDGSNLMSNWYKNGTQNKPGKLVNDGVTTDNDGIAIEVEISGLEPGSYGIQTYNNSWENGDAFEFPTFDAYLNGEKVYADVKPTCRVATNEEGTCLFYEMTITSADQTTVIRLSPVSGYVPVENKSNGLYNRVFLNALEIGVGNAAQQPKAVLPSDNDLHYNCDGGEALFAWSPTAANANFDLYVGADSTEVAALGIAPVWQGTDTSCLVKGTFHSFADCYWCVVQHDADGGTVKSPVWRFRPRRDAFRGAEGYGRYALGGRGGKVVHVTNLNDAGEGSFREALTNDIGPRTIVFDVSGVIELKSRLTQVGKYVTVAGQTAPGNGICFKAAPLGIGSESQWRHVRMRLGGGKTFDGIGMAGVNFSILDHASIAWTIDEAFSSRGAQNITLQRTLISEALNAAGHENYSYGTQHGYAGSVGGDVGSLHHNLLAHCYGRNWSLAGGLDGDGYYAGRMDIFNTVVYNYGHRATDGGAKEVNFVGNYYKLGPATDIDFMLNAQLEGGGKGYQAYYYHNNIKANRNGTIAYKGDNDAQGRKYTLSGGQKLDWDVWVTEPWFDSQAEVESAADAYKSVMSDVGCTMPVFDNHDQRVVRETLTGTSTYRGSYTKLAGMPDKAADSDSIETYAFYIEETRPADFDTDRDGLPDWWEEIVGTSANSASGDFSDANADADGDGWSNLEDYLDYMAVPHAVVPNDTVVTFNILELASNYTSPVLQSLTFDRNAGFGATVQNDTLAVVSVPAGRKGYAFLTLAGQDADGSTFKRLVAVAAPDKKHASDIETIQVCPSDRGRTTVWDASGRLVSDSEQQPALKPGLYLRCSSGGVKKLLIR